MTTNVQDHRPRRLLQLLEGRYDQDKNGNIYYTDEHVADVPITEDWAAQLRPYLEPHLSDHIAYRETGSGKRPLRLLDGHGVLLELMEKGLVSLDGERRVVVLGSRTTEAVVDLVVEAWHALENRGGAEVFATADEAIRSLIGDPQ